MSELPPQIALLQLVTGYWVSQSLNVAARLGLADLLKDGPRSVNDLAQSVKADLSSLYRLLRGLANVGVFKEVGEKRFALTPLADCLRSDVPHSMKGFAMMNGTESHWNTWSRMLDCVKTGEPAFKKIYGKGLFEGYFEDHPEEGAIFDQAMTNASALAIPEILKGYDFSGIKTLVDAGGGVGSLLFSILKAHPSLKGILYELKSVIERARPFLSKEKLEGRCELIAGDLTKSFPAGADAYLMKHIIHGLGDNEAVDVLQKCHKAMAKDGKLILVEMVIPSGNEPSFGKLLDLNMLVMAGGKERTESEYRDLYRGAGFELTRIIPTASPISIIEGKRM